MTGVDAMLEERNELARELSRTREQHSEDVARLNDRIEKLVAALEKARHILDGPHYPLTLAEIDEALAAARLQRDRGVAS